MAGATGAVFSFGEDFYGQLGTAAGEHTHVAEQAGEINGGPHHGTPFAAGESIRLRLCSFVPQEVPGVEVGAYRRSDLGPRDDNGANYGSVVAPAEFVDPYDVYDIRTHMHRRRQAYRELEPGQRRAYKDVRHRCFAKAERAAAAQGRAPDGRKLTELNFASNAGEWLDSDDSFGSDDEWSDSSDDESDSDDVQR